MEQLLFVLTNPMSKVLMLLSGGVIGLLALTIRFITKVRGSFQPYQKATLWYLFIFLLFFSLTGLTAHPSVITSTETFFIIDQVCFLVAGVLHYHLMHYFLKWSGDEKSFWLELVFTLLLTLLGGVAFVTVFSFLDTNGLAYWMTGSILFFMIPFFFYQSFRAAMAIPPKILKQWFYPVHEEVAEPDEKKLKHLLVISFEFQKQVTNVHYTNFRAKAPVDMDLGELFYYFINDYNDRHPHAKIQYVSEAGEPHGWVFYKKRKWYSFLTQYIDAEKTVFKNGIRENDVIICNRSLY